ncbi:MAG: histidine kinase [Proteobacteria bacterium]|nr:histidine kinase [Pseudomonadota bacterium]
MTENIANNNANHYDETTSSLLPNFCEVRNIFFAVLFTEILAIIFAMAASSSSKQFWDYLALSSLLMLWIALLNSAVLCALRNRLNKLKPTPCMLLSFCLMIGVSLLVASLASLASSFFYLDQGSFNFNRLFFIRVMTISAAIYFLLLRYFYIQHQWRINLAAQSRAEIQALRARIRPHFLFNSMNTIASLIGISPDTAEKAIEDLSDLFRASLSEKNMSRLGEEIELTESYLAIESLRLGDRLQIEWQVDQNLLDIEVPALCIQPLAENAIYHGIEPLPEGGKIVISALQIDNRLKISVSNPLMPEIEKAKQGNQMAQDNIKQRLKLVYGDKSEFSINDTKESYTVSLSIPLT